MTADGFTITRAIQSRSWPAASANLEYAAVWGGLGPVTDGVLRVADDIAVSRISTLLEPAGRVSGNPIRLAENAGIAFQGCIVLGMGFVVDVAEAQEWIAADASNAGVLFPYLNGEDLNQRPDASASRWVIDFNDRSESAASRYGLPFARVTRTSKGRANGEQPEGLRGTIGGSTQRTRPAMRKAIAGLPEVLVIARVSKTVMPLRVLNWTGLPREAGRVRHRFDTQLRPSCRRALHQLWAIKYGTTMRNRRYIYTRPMFSARYRAQRPTSAWLVSD